MAVTVRSYAPGGTRLNRNRPCVSVSVRFVKCVSVLVNSIAADGTEAPVASTTVPDNVVVGVTWASAANRARENTAMTNAYLMSAVYNRGTADSTRP